MKEGEVKTGTIKVTCEITDDLFSKSVQLISGATLIINELSDKTVTIEIIRTDDKCTREGFRLYESAINMLHNAIHEYENHKGEGDKIC